MKKISSILSTAATAVYLLLSGVTVVSAQTLPAPGTSGGGITNPAIGTLGDTPSKAEKGFTFVEYFLRLWNAAMVVGSLLLIIYFIWGAIEWITSGGDSGKAGKARDKITQAVIGLILLVTSFTIITTINYIFFGDDFDILNLQF